MLVVLQFPIQLVRRPISQYNAERQKHE